MGFRGVLMDLGVSRGAFVREFTCSNVDLGCPGSASYVNLRALGVRMSDLHVNLHVRMAIWSVQGSIFP